jgi:DNA-damage-inducible protein J
MKQDGTKSAMIRARVEPKLKQDVEKLFAKLGLSSSEAIQLFYAQVRLRKGLPFDVVIPNATTRTTLRRSDEGKGLGSAKNADDLFEQLGI